MTVVEGFLTGNFFVVFAKMIKHLLFFQFKYNIKALSSEDLNGLNDADPYFFMVQYAPGSLGLYDIQLRSENPICMDLLQNLDINLYFVCLGDWKPSIIN